MSIVLTIVAFIIILSVLVLVHEFGHFFTARISGVKVEEFGLGYPPRIYGYKHGETLYSINAIPFGGFCKMLGEEDPQYPRSLASKSVATRILILAAGSLMNILLPIVLFAISFMVPHNTVYETVVIEEVACLINKAVFSINLHGKEEFRSSRRNSICSKTAIFPGTRVHHQDLGNQEQGNQSTHEESRKRFNHSYSHNRHMSTPSLMHYTTQQPQSQMIQA